MLSALPSAYLTPEVVPAMDESAPQIAPNQANDEELCEAVMRHLKNNFWFGYEQMQMRFWPVWRRIDDMWRARASLQDVDPMPLTGKSIDRQQPSQVDGISQPDTPADMHKGLDALLNVGCQMDFGDGNIPARYVKPESVREGQFYNPEQQSIDAANALLQEAAQQTRLKREFRKNFGSFARYGVAWSLEDLHRTFETQLLSYTIPAQQAQMAAPALMQQYGGQTPKVERDASGNLILTFRQRAIKDFYTAFRHVDIQNVFTDLLMPCDDMERHPAPFVRERVQPTELWNNVYEATDNPFGWLNIEEAMSDTYSHYTLTEQDEEPLRQQLAHRYNLTDQVGYQLRDTFKQLWTCWPLLGLARVPKAGGESEWKIDDGKGISCPVCAPGVSVDCPTCKGSGTVRVKPERYCVQMFGGLRQSTACLRIQKMPAKMKVPLRFAGHLIEDTSCAYPMSKVEIAETAFRHLTKATNQFLDAKEKTIERGWKVKEDSPAMKVQDLNKPGQKIPFEVDAGEAERVESNNFDETVTLMPFMQFKENDIKLILNVTDQILGMLSTGRRSALELGNAIDAGKNPLVMMVDGYNDQMMKGWAETSLRNWETWGDRDWIMKRTGRPFFGDLRIFCAVGEEFVKKITRTQNLRYFMETMKTIPQMQSVMPSICRELASDFGLDNIEFPTDELEMARDEAMTRGTKMLSDGFPMPAEPDDLHEVFIRTYAGFLKDPFWQKHAPQNLPMLMQVRMEHIQMLQMQQMQMAAQQAMMNPQGQPGQQQSAQPPKPYSDSGGAMQSAQGA